MSRPRPSPPATWPSRRAPATRIRAPLPHFPTNGRNAGVSPLGTPAFRPFVRPRARAASLPLTPPPHPRERAKCPSRPADKAGHFARSRGRLTVGRSAAAGGADVTAWRRGPPDGAATGLQTVACSARGSPRRTSGRNIRVRPESDRGISPARLGAGVPRRDGVRPTASGRNAAVRPRGGRGISPARGHDARPGGIGAAGGVEATVWRRGVPHRGRGGPPGGRPHRMRLT